MYPFRFHSYLRPMPWGGRRLGQSLGKSLPDDGSYGESWEISDHPHHHSVVANGQFAGRSLRELMDEQRTDLLGSAAENFSRFPWLVKFLDVKDWLSVQVHPGEEAVKTLLPAEGSKTEAWFILDAAPESRIYAGLNEGVDETSLRRSSKNGEVTGCLHQFAPRPGDCVYLPAGTVHAVGGGVLMAEIQQTSDATFRLYDWDRRDREGRARQLHLEESFASIHWQQGPIQPIRVKEGPNHSGDSLRTELVRCSYFNIDHVELTAPVPVHGMNVVIIFSGSVQFTAPDIRESGGAGQVWLIPADCSRAEIWPHNSASVLICSLPD